MPGISLTEAFREADDYWSGADVELARATRVIGRARGVPDGIPDPGLVSAGLLVVLGSGVDAGHPAIKERLVDNIDLTGEGAHDHNGGTTRYVLDFLHQAGTSTELKVVSVKVVDSRGCGSVRQFVQGLATASRLGASVVLAPLQVDIVDWHLLGTVRRIHGACPILAIPAERGRGACYPDMASEFVVYWRPAGG